jgi:hypothetical protein
VQLTRHLYQFFPTLDGQDLQVAGGTVAEVVRALDGIAPGIGLYICDERGRMRQHVNIFVGNERITDRQRLSDPVSEHAEVIVMQALSGG